MKQTMSESQFPRPRRVLDLTDPVVLAEAPAYACVGRSPVGCGCIRAAIVDNPFTPERTARWVQDFIASGLVIERVDSRLVKVQFGHCDRCKPPQDVQLELPL